jgi:hypothetical protein
VHAAFVRREHGRVPMDTLYRQQEKELRVINVSGFDLSCGLFALALGIKIAKQTQQVKWEELEKFVFLDAISVNVLQK